MPIPSREKLVKIVEACLPWACGHGQLEGEEGAIEYLKSRICYGPPLPACKRCSHTICPCCYPTMNWCDLCLSKGDISGTVDFLEVLRLRASECWRCFRSCRHGLFESFFAQFSQSTAHGGRGFLSASSHFDREVRQGRESLSKLRPSTRRHGLPHRR